MTFVLVLKTRPWSGDLTSDATTPASRILCLGLDCETTNCSGRLDRRAERRRKSFRRKLVDLMPVVLCFGSRQLDEFKDTSSLMTQVRAPPYNTCSRRT